MCVCVRARARARVRVCVYICMYMYVCCGISGAEFCRFWSKLHLVKSGFGGLEVACWPLVPKFAGSNPAEAVGFFRAKKSSARLPSEGK